MARFASHGVMSWVVALELGTAALALLLPELLLALLLGLAPSDTALTLVRFFGIALLAFGLASWPLRDAGSTRSAVPMLAYNALMALYLAYLGAVKDHAGPLLWPASVLHAAIALVLAGPWLARRWRRLGVERP